MAARDRHLPIRLGPHLAAARLACCLLGAAVVAVIVLLTAAPASAHAVLVWSSPTAGATVDVTPDAVVLAFDEPLVARFSKASVIDPDGRRYTGVVTGRQMRVVLRGSARGTYQVAWTTVSEVDGHTITGAFRFGVGVTVPVTATRVGPVVRPGDLVVAALHMIEYAALLLACGLAALARLAGTAHAGADPAIRATAGADSATPPVVRQPVVAVATALLSSAVLVVAAEVVQASGGLSASALVGYLAIGVAGAARLAVILLAVGLLAVAVDRHYLSPVLLAGIVVALAAAGHAASVDPAWLGIAVNALHLAAAGIWAGGIMALALVRFSHAWPVAGRPLLRRFSRVAVWAFAISVLLGAAQAAQLLGTPGQIVHSGYGLTLLAKSAAVAAMVPLSFVAWRWQRPMLRTEATLAVVVVAAAAALAAYPLVPKEAREAADNRDGPPAGSLAVASPFPRTGDLTMAASAGDTLVGLTLRPGRPGRNRLLVYLNPSPDAGARVEVDIDGVRAELPACGPSCRAGSVLLRGGDPIAVRIGGVHGGSAALTLPTLPAADGSALVTRATGNMTGLRSYRVEEVLAGIRSSYIFVRPNQVWQRIWLDGVPHDTVWLGTSVYKRARPSAPWSAPSPTPPVSVPYVAWLPFRPLVDQSVTGSVILDGRRTILVSLFGGHGDDPEPVWFTLWIDPATDRVLRSQMWAPGHAMDDRYHAFNEPVDLRSLMARPS
jgi:copper transport protein